MNIPVKVTPPARVRRPWLLGAIIAALLAVAVVISLYEFSPEFRLMVGYKPLEKRLCAVENVNRSIGKVSVKCYEKRIGWGYMLVTSDEFFVQVDRPNFHSTAYREKFAEISDDERKALENYVLDEVVTVDTLREIMSWWCKSYDYYMMTRQRNSNSYYYGPYPLPLTPRLSYDGSDERHVYASAHMWGMDNVSLTLNRATGEITARTADE